MITLESDNFTLRPVEGTDAQNLIDAVGSSVKRLKKDFPGLEKRYVDLANVRARAEVNHDLTIDQDSGTDVMVATDPENTIVFGMLTRTRLSKASQGLLSLNMWTEASQPICGAAMVAGWTTEEHPEELPVQALRHAINEGVRYLDEGSEIYGSNFVTTALIRPANTASMSVAAEAGMNQARGLIGRPKVVSFLVASAAYSRTTRRQGLWLHENPIPRLGYLA